MYVVPRIDSFPLALHQAGPNSSTDPDIYIPRAQDFLISIALFHSPHRRHRHLFPATRTKLGMIFTNENASQVFSPNTAPRARHSRSRTTSPTLLLTPNNQDWGITSPYAKTRWHQFGISTSLYPAKDSVDEMALHARLG